MYSVNDTTLNFNKNFKFNFEGGDLSSDGGLLLVKEFISKIGLDKTIKSIFKTNDPALYRWHTDFDNLMQMVFQILGAYFTDDCADSLTFDPVFNAVLGKDTLASQPTLSRFFNRMDDTTLQQFYTIMRKLRKIVYAISTPSESILDLDSTLLDAYGNQEGSAFNYHYQNYGYHPLVCYEANTGDLIKLQLRGGSAYSCTDVKDFLEPVLDEYADDYPNIKLKLRGDSGFATPELYELCENEKYGVQYAIRLKSNCVLKQLCQPIETELDKKVKADPFAYSSVYGEFMYQAGSWNHARRVVCKIEKPQGQLVYMYTFIVTNMDSKPERVVEFYCKRGTMENFIKESKNGFDFAAVSSSTEMVNANRVQVHVLAYNLFNWFKRLVLAPAMRRHQIDTVRLELLKISVRVITTAGYTIFKLCSYCPYQDEFYETYNNIQNLKVQLE